MQTDPAKLASYVLDEKTTDCPIPLPELHVVFEKIWTGVEGAFKGLGGFEAASRADYEYFSTLFAPSEVLTHLKATDKKSAAGIDGIKRDDLLLWDPKGEKLSKLYDSWLAAVCPEVRKSSKDSAVTKELELGLGGMTVYTVQR